MKIKSFPLLLILAIAGTALQAQDFVQNYALGIGDGYWRSCKFTAITSKVDVSGAVQLFVAGTSEKLDGTGPHEIAILQLAGNGTLIDTRVISSALFTDVVTPTGILQDLKGIGFNDILTICGYIGSNDHGNAFVLRYNFTTQTLLWINKLNEESAFFDIDKLNNATFLVAGHETPGNQNAILFSVDKTTGAFSIFHQFQWQIDGTDCYYAIDVENSTHDVTMGARLEAFPVMTGSLNMKSALMRVNSAGGFIFYRYLLSTANTHSRLYTTDVGLNGDGSVVYGIASGDITGSEIYKDVFLLNMNATTFASNSVKIEFPSQMDGFVNSLKLYSNVMPMGIVKQNELIYGSKSDDDGNLTDVYLMRVNQPMNAALWTRAYTDVHLTPYTPNSMIVVNSMIYAVGWTTISDAYTRNAGVLISTPVLTDAICGDPFDVDFISNTIQNQAFNTPPDDNNLTTPGTINHLPINTSQTDNCTGFTGNINTRYSEPLSGSAVVVTTQIPGIAEFNMHIDGDETTHLLTIYNLIGEQITQRNVESVDRVILNLQQGVYIYSITGIDEKNAVGKFLVN